MHERGDLAVRVEASAFFVACIKAGYIEEAEEFADWYLETFDNELRD